MVGMARENALTFHLLHYFKAKHTTLVQAQSLFAEHWDDALVAIILGPLIISLTKHFLLPEGNEPGHDLLFKPLQNLKVFELEKKEALNGDTTRNICHKLELAKKDVVLFWGSQSGKAARLAKELAMELETARGIATTAEDLDLYDHEHLASLPKDKIVGFIVSTYGEGDSTDNAEGFATQLQKWTAEGTDLSNLRFLAFGLGSSNYLEYNKFVDVVNSVLVSQGAKRVGSPGKLDAVAGSDDAWMHWKESILADLSQLVERRLTGNGNNKAALTPEIQLLEIDNAPTTEMYVCHVCEQQAKTSRGRVKVHPARIADSRVLSTPGTRQYLHVEFDISDSTAGLSYTAGDHVAIWPVNRQSAVNQWAELFGWSKERLQSLIHIKLKSESSISPNPLQSPMTRQAILTYYLDLCGPVAAQYISMLSHFAPTLIAKQKMQELNENPDAWARIVSGNLATYGDIMDYADPSARGSWPEELFLMLMQTLPPLSPRYFSIASSPLRSPDRVAATVGVLSRQRHTGGDFLGLTTNYLSSLHQHRQVTGGLTKESEGGVAYDFNGPRMVLSGPKVFIHIRQSHFKLPQSAAVPIVMVGAGSGIAPFMGFLQERQAQHECKVVVGKTLLIFGCRSKDQDYLYQDQLEHATSQFPWFHHEVVFSRASPTKKTYVQDKVEQLIENILSILEQGGHFYICGRIDMSRKIKKVLIKGLTHYKGLNDNEAQGFVEKMKRLRFIQEDVWE